MCMDALEALYKDTWYAAEYVRIQVQRMGPTMLVIMIMMMIQIRMAVIPSRVYTTAMRTAIMKMLVMMMMMM